MVFTVEGAPHAYGIANRAGALITIEKDKCIMKKGNDYVNITINDASKFDQQLVFGNDTCVASFAPECLFKPVEPGNVIPQRSFSFARFQNGNNSVTINFSLKKSESSVDATLIRKDAIFCSWYGMNLDLAKIRPSCKNLTENKEEGRLDFTLEYQREGSEDVTKFLFGTSKSGVGVTVYWNKKGERISWLLVPTKVATLLQSQRKRRDGRREVYSPRQDGGVYFGVDHRFCISHAEVVSPQTYETLKRLERNGNENEVGSPCKKARCEDEDTPHDTEGMMN
nr:Taenia soluim Excretory and Secretory Product(TSES)38 protein [Hymenolepis microstoma]